MEEDLVVLLGGRVSESLTLDDISTGASNDIERATKLAHSMIAKYGMSEELGPITYGRDESEPFLGRDMGHVRDYSEATSCAIDREIKRMMTEAYHKTENILNEHMDQLHVVAKYLFENEKMSGEEFAKIMKESREPAGDAPSGAIPTGKPENPVDAEPVQ
jgi:cell division protease FtsH